MTPRYIDSRRARSEYVFFSFGISFHVDFHAYPAGYTALAQGFFQGDLGGEPRAVEGEDERRSGTQLTRQELDSLRDARLELGPGKMQPTDDLG